eukprot:g21198.t1
MGTKLGVKLSEDLEVLRIDAFGAVASWNVSNPLLSIHLGDRILQAAKLVSPDKIFASLQSEGELDLLVGRVERRLDASTGGICTYKECQAAYPDADLRWANMQRVPDTPEGFPATQYAADTDCHFLAYGAPKGESRDFLASESFYRTLSLRCCSHFHVFRNVLWRLVRSRTLADSRVPQHSPGRSLARLATPAALPETVATRSSFCCPCCNRLFHVFLNDGVYQAVAATGALAGIQLKPQQDWLLKAHDQVFTATLEAASLAAEIDQQSLKIKSIQEKGSITSWNLQNPSGIGMALSHSLCALPRRPRCFVRTKSTQQSILSAAARGDAEGIYLALKHHELSPISVATAAHRLAKLRPLRASNTLRQRGLRELQAPILAAHTDFGAQATANTVWTLAVLRSTDEIVWEYIQEIVKQLLEVSAAELLESGKSLGEISECAEQVASKRLMQQVAVLNSQEEAYEEVINSGDRIFFAAGPEQTCSEYRRSMLRHQIAEDERKRCVADASDPRFVRRIDPMDGVARTFSELQRVHALSMAEMDVYWQKCESLYPHDQPPAELLQELQRASETCKDLLYFLHKRTPQLKKTRVQSFASRRPAKTESAHCFALLSAQFCHCQCEKHISFARATLACAKPCHAMKTLGLLLTICVCGNAGELEAPAVQQALKLLTNLQSQVAEEGADAQKPLPLRDIDAFLDPVFVPDFFFDLAEGTEVFDALSSVAPDGQSYRASVLDLMVPEAPRMAPVLLWQTRLWRALSGADISQVIIDVGAHEWSRFLPELRADPRAWLVLVEPGRAAFLELYRRLKVDYADVLSRVVALPVALSWEPGLTWGFRSLHTNDFLGGECNSLLAPNESFDHACTAKGPVIIVPASQPQSWAALGAAPGRPSRSRPSICSCTA